MADRGVNREQPGELGGGELPIADQRAAGLECDGQQRPPIPAVPVDDEGARRPGAKRAQDLGQGTNEDLAG